MAKRLCCSQRPRTCLAGQDASAEGGWDRGPAHRSSPCWPGSQSSASDSHLCLALDQPLQAAGMKGHCLGKGKKEEGEKKCT